MTSHVTLILVRHTGDGHSDDPGHSSHQHHESGPPTPGATRSRRIYNISGRVSSVERGYLDGPSEVWVAQLTDLAPEYCLSALVLGAAEDAGSGITPES